jgi:hypothetical protein
MGLIHALDDQDGHPTDNAADAETQKCSGLCEKLCPAA